MPERAEAIYVWFGLTAVGIIIAVISRSPFVGAIVGLVLAVAGLIAFNVPLAADRLGEWRFRLSVREDPALPEPESQKVLTGVVVRALPPGTERSGG